MGIPPKYKVSEIIGDLEILEYLGSSQWKTKCTCGHTVEVHSTIFKNKYPSCKDCTRTRKLQAAVSMVAARPTNKPKVNYTGHVICGWKIGKYSGTNVVGYACTCINCGIKRNIIGQSLKNSKLKKCTHQIATANIEVIDENKIEFTFSEISIILQTSVTSVRATYSSAMKKIQKAVEKKSSGLSREYLDEYEKMLVDSTWGN